MSETSKPTRFGLTAQALHWGMAMLIIGIWVLGSLIDEVPKGPLRMEIVGTHKSLGIIVLALAVFRLAWRLTHPVPDLPETMRPWERRGAQIGHVLLYALMVALPLVGIVISQSAGYQASVFGWFSLPTVIEKSKDVKEIAEGVHAALAMTLAAVVAVHVAAALRHHFVLKDDVLRRMLPSRR